MTYQQDRCGLSGENQFTVERFPRNQSLSFSAIGERPVVTVKREYLKVLPCAAQ